MPDKPVDSLKSLCKGRGRTQRLKLFCKNHVQHGQQHQNVTAGLYKQMLVCNICSFCFARVYHDQFSTPLADGLKTFRYTRCGHQTAIGHHRVCTKYNMEAGAIQVGQGNQQAVSEHQQGYQLLGQLVDRGCGIATFGSQGAEKHRPEQHCVKIMHSRVAKIDGDRVFAVLSLNALQLRGDFIKSLLP